jgi:hypothetical protein
MTTNLINVRTLDAHAAAALTAHLFAEQLPLASQEEQIALRRSLQAEGQQSAVVLYEGAILDGRNRVAAAVAAGLPITVGDFPGSEAEARTFALVSNTARRQLNDSQLAVVAAQSRCDMNLTQPEAAEFFGVSERYVRDADYLLAHGTARQVREVFNGVRSLRTVIREVRGSRAPGRERPVLVNRFARNPSLVNADSTVLDPAMQATVTSAVSAFAAGVVDAAGWVRGLPPEQAVAIVAALDGFVRDAAAILTMEGHDVPEPQRVVETPAPAPAPAARRPRAASPV